MISLATKGPKFTPWRTPVEVWSGWAGIDGTMREKYEFVTEARKKKRFSDDQKTFIATGMSATRRWYNCGRPYYKVWPGMVEALRNTALNISVDSFVMPYESFAVMMPSDMGGSFLVIKIDRSEFDSFPKLADGLGDMDSRVGREFRFALGILLWGEEDDLTSCRLRAFEGDLFRSAIEREVPIMLSGHFAHEPTVFANLWRVAIAVAYFGVDNHEVVCPDIEKPIIDLNCRPKLRKMRQENAAKKHARNIANCKGWLVGSEIDLPRPEVINRGDVRHGTGTELTAGHIRSGHMRMQACGEALKDHKLIFVPPTVVRPDLPFRQTHGYRIGRPKCPA